MNWQLLFPALPFKQIFKAEQMVVLDEFLTTVPNFVGGSVHTLDPSASVVLNGLGSTLFRVVGPSRFDTATITVDPATGGIVVPSGAELTAAVGSIVKFRAPVVVAGLGNEGNPIPISDDVTIDGTLGVSDSITVVEDVTLGGLLTAPVVIAGTVQRSGPELLIGAGATSAQRIDKQTDPVDTDYDPTDFDERYYTLTASDVHNWSLPKGNNRQAVYVANLSATGSGFTLQIVDEPNSAIVITLGPQVLARIRWNGTAYERLWAVLLAP